MNAPMTTAPTLQALRNRYLAAQRAWNRDNGPVEKTVKAGEDLYFAAEALIEALEEVSA